MDVVAGRHFAENNHEVSALGMAMERAESLKSQGKDTADVEKATGLLKSAGARLSKDEVKSGQKPAPAASRPAKYNGKNLYDALSEALRLTAIQPRLARDKL